MAMSQADADEQAALANLNTQLIGQAQNAYQSLQATANDYNRQVSESVNRGQNMNRGFADNMAAGAAGGYDTQTAGPLNSQIGIDGGQSMDPYAMYGSKRREDTQGQPFWA
jgi:hypothetical protein